MITFPIETIIPKKIFVETQISIIDYQIQNMTKKKERGELNHTPRKKNLETLVAAVVKHQYQQKLS